MGEFYNGTRKDDNNPNTQKTVANSPYLRHNPATKCVCGLKVADLPPDHSCFPKPKAEGPTRRSLQIADLRHLLSFPRLGAWGMEVLIDTLNQVVPELAENPVSQGQHSAIEE